MSDRIADLVYGAVYGALFSILVWIVLIIIFEAPVNALLTLGICFIAGALVGYFFGKRWVEKIGGVIFALSSAL